MIKRPRWVCLLVGWPQNWFVSEVKIGQTKFCKNDRTYASCSSPTFLALAISSSWSPESATIDANSCMTIGRGSVRRKNYKPWSITVRDNQNWFCFLVLLLLFVPKISYLRHRLRDTAAPLSWPCWCTRCRPLKWKKNKNWRFRCRKNVINWIHVHLIWNPKSLSILQDIYSEIR